MVFIGTEEQRTRERVLAAVSEHGPVTAAEVGRQLGLTPAAVRRHLDALSDQGSVSEYVAGTTPQHSRGRGRPARAYVLSERGHVALRTDYDGLATQALRYLQDTAGPQAVTAFARERVAHLEERYAARLATTGHDLGERADVLVEALTEDGFAASTRPVAAGAFTGIQLCQGHCPVGRVAQEFPAFCDAETEAISRLLGVHVQRLATLAGGAHVCTTFIPTPSVTRPDAALGTPGLSATLDLPMADTTAATSMTTPERASR